MRLALLIGVMASSGGCSWFDASDTKFFSFSQRGSHGDIETATNDPSPDKRREAVTRLGNSRRASNEEVATVLAEIAMGDSSQSVRTVAFGALAKSCHSSGHDAAIETLNAEGKTEANASAAPAVLTAALDLLTTCAANNQLDQRRANIAAQHAIALLNSHRSRNVRQAGARFLGYVPTRQALDALIESLGQRDFGVCYEAERSLMRLTGEFHDHNTEAWRTFVDSTPDPFANRGALDDKLENDDPNWWQRQRNKWRKLNVFANKKQDS